jgi:hypothetical protein
VSAAAPTGSRRSAFISGGVGACSTPSSDGAARRVRISGGEITDLRILATHPATDSAPTAIRDLLDALRAAEWSKTLPLELTVDAQLAYRIAATRHPDWRIGPDRMPAYRNVVTQLPAHIRPPESGRSGTVLVTETMGALRAHHTAHSAGQTHIDHVIVGAINAAEIDDTTTHLTCTDAVITLLHMLSAYPSSGDLARMLLERIAFPRARGGR